MAEEYKRKCENWLRTFGEWTLPRSEAPETFIFWTGLFTLASVVKRKVRVPKRLLGSWEAAPNLYILFIAPAGKARKSTTANYTEELVDLIPSITKAPELITKESLLSQLVKSDDASMCIVAPEFGEFIVKSGTDMFGFLTNMYDGKKNISASTLSRGAEFAERPVVNLLGATTPEWVAENMPESVIGGGFASRVVFIYEEKVRRRKMYYDDLDFGYLERLHSDLVDDLTHIANNIAGEFTLAPAAKAFMEDWYEHNADAGDASSNKLSGYFERRPAHIHKVAMLLHLAYSDELEIQQADFEGAIELLGKLEKKLPKVFESIGKNPYTVDIYRILAFISEKGRVSKAEVRRNFMHAAEPSKISELIDGLHAAGYINQDIEGMETYLSKVVKLEVSTNGKVPTESKKMKFDPTKVRAAVVSSD